MEKQYKLLIVDDETGILDVYRQYFVKREFIVDIAHNGLEGLKKLNANEYDVAIIDIRMPKMDGITLAQKVRETGIDTSIIILTGHGDKG